MNSINDVASIYNQRFQKFGRDIRTVGWGSKSSQIMRFDFLLRDIDLEGKTIVDYGCGFGDLAMYIKNLGVKDYSYFGIDASSELVKYAKIEHEAYRNHSFEVGNFNESCLKISDISVVSGAFSLKYSGIEENTKLVIEKIFNKTSNVASFNFLSKYCDYENPKDQHYSPELIFSHAKKLTKNVNLFHSYPLYEFTIQIFK